MVLIVSQDLSLILYHLLSTLSQCRLVNGSDLAPRAIEVLSQVNLILAEDTRVSGQILKSVGV